MFVDVTDADSTDKVREAGMSIALTAEDIAQLCRPGASNRGPLELQLIELAAEAKRAGDGRDVLLRVHFPQTVGGLEIVCHRRIGWRTRLARWLLKSVEVD